MATKRRVLYVYGGPEFHPTEACGEILRCVLAADGRFELDITADLDAFARLPTRACYALSALSMVYSGHDNTKELSK